MNLEQLNIQKDMSKEDVAKQFFQLRKKLISRQNSPNIQKRTEAEIQLLQMNTAENIMKNLSEEKRKAGFYLETWLCAEKHQSFNDSFQSALIDASKGDENSITQITNALCGQWREEKLGKQWKSLSDEVGHKQQTRSQVNFHVKPEKVDENKETVHNNTQEQFNRRGSSTNNDEAHKQKEDVDLAVELNRFLEECWVLFLKGVSEFFEKVALFISSEEERRRMIHSFFQNLEELLVGRSKDTKEQEFFYKRDETENDDTGQESREN